jgi:CBS domain containing-hemolysin-like protein
MNQLGEIPRAGQKFEWDNFTFIVTQMDGHRVERVEIIQNNEE